MKKYSLFIPILFCMLFSQGHAQTSKWRLLGGRYLTNASGDTVGLFRSDGRLQHPEEKDQDIIAWFSPVDSGANKITVFDNKEVYAFGSTSDSVLTNSWMVPKWFTKLDSVVMVINVPDNSDKSSAWRLSINPRSIVETHQAVYFETLQDTVDHGFLAQVGIRIVWKGFTAPISPEDEVICRIMRNNTIANNTVAAVNARRVIWYYR